MAKTPGNAGQGRLVAVVVTHNRLAHLKTSLSRLLETPKSQLEAVVVVDNASSDGSAEWLAAQADARICILTSRHNSGGAGGFDQGMRHAARVFDPDWLVLMDDDARPAPGALAAFHAQDLAGWGAVAAAVFYPDGRICEINRPARNPFRNRRASLRFLARGRDAVHLQAPAFGGAPVPVDWSSFVGFFISREALALAGFPDPKLFIYADDVLYTLGLTRRGGKLGFFPALHFEHACGSLAKGTARRLHPLWRTYYYHRNQVFLYRALAGPWFWPVILPLIAKWALKLRYHPGARRRFLKLLWWAVRDGIGGRKEIDPAVVFAAAEPRKNELSRRYGGR